MRESDSESEKMRVGVKYRKGNGKGMLERE